MLYKVSVIIPSYNSSSTLKRAIESVLNQSHKNIEILLTDDNSSDDTGKIINDYERKYHNIKGYYLKENKGAGYSRNIATRHASGDFIAFLDSDDYWYPYKLEKQIEFMTYRKIHFTYSSYDVVDELGIMKNNVEARSVIDYRDILRNNYIGCLTVIYDVRHFGKLYMPQIRKRQDWCLWIDIIKREGPIYGIKDSLAAYSIQKQSLSSNKINLLKYNWLVYRKHLGLGYLRSYYLLSRYIMFYVYKKSKIYF
ncbi:glycosyltransferase family 2 protein [Schleiferiaceae bacterium]|nr:glycosyltransferase family 2 protein [Schleiferiaceae bacterium]